MSRKVIPCTVKINDGMNRFHSGDRGVLLVNDFEKYDYLVRLAKRMEVKLPWESKARQRVRQYYFYKGEIELGEPVEAPEDGEAFDQWLLTL